MRLVPLLLPAVLLAVGARPGAAQVPPILQALRAQAWPTAQAMAAAEPDPVAARLVTFIRLLNPDQASAADLADFIAANPGWPDQDVLERRYGEALAGEPDEKVAASLCRRHPTAAPLGLLRCAEAWALGGDPARAARVARQAWVALPGTAPQEDETLARWAGVLTQADERARFDRLEPTDADAAARQSARLDPPARALATARLAFRRRDPDALARLAAVPADLRADPALLLAEARFLRRAQAGDAALALWRTALPAAEAATTPDRRAPFWAERDALARDRLDADDAAGAYALADDTLLAPDQAVDAAFLAGWIALRRLHDPVRARAKFQALASGARAAITQARAFYWLSRAQTDPDASRTSLALAAAWPTTYYGQIAARAAGETDDMLQARIAALRDPPADASLAGTELARAARVLVAWADPRRAADFLRQLAQPPATAADRAAVAQLALRLGLPDVAVQAARLAGRDGAVLAQSGWPAPVRPPQGTVPASLVLGLMRQESSFDPLAASAAGAHGLMQLMPATAAQLARGLHAPAGPLSDPDINMRLGTAYLGGLLAQFGGAVPYAVAAYDAGGRHVRDWMTAHGDATSDPDAMIDWIELIPYAETRNYVQRVLENQVVYRARLASFPPGAGPG